MHIRMDDSVDDNENFVFSGIFPVCLEDIKMVIRNIDYSPLYYTYQNNCNHYGIKLAIDNPKFLTYCMHLSFYLDHIKKESSDNKEASCKYFNYILKYFVRDINPSCKVERECYNRMINAKYANIEGMSDICLQYVINFNDDTFQKFDNLYNLYNTLINNGDTCLSNSTCFNKYTEVSSSCQDGKKGNFCKVLQSFKELYINDGENEQKEDSEIMYTSTGTYIRMIFLSLSFSTFVISLIVFILYKYTPSSSYLKPMIMKLKRIFNKKNDEYLTLLDPFEYTYKNSIDQDYRIEYSSVYNT
ncbi:variable surface protein [Plasmodium gonderi]|uniref:Variable surface protein n=1 Tax=Plasmodium gonderi TaxID=77519 RepID=A0A1Y1JSZ6_PLAGO|nr:variable surface protein [Plasmodium gonderi]GAW84558.1 variable surface protein [Plasmodium gonderi]